MQQPIDREKLQQAFALAHKAIDREDTPDRERKELRAIAYLIWKACGNTDHAPGHEEAKALVG